MGSTRRLGGKACFTPASCLLHVYLRLPWHSGKTATESSETWGCREELLLTSFCDLGQLCELPEPRFPHLCSVGVSTTLICCEDLMREDGVRRAGRTAGGQGALLQNPREPRALTLGWGVRGERIRVCVRPGHSLCLDSCQTERNAPSLLARDLLPLATLSLTSSHPE